MLQKSGRAEWVSEEMAELTDPGLYKIDPQEIWRKFKWRADKPRLRALLRELAAWRELEAQRLNVPRNRVVRDEALMEIAHHRARKDAHELSRIARPCIAVSPKAVRAREILAAVAKAGANALAGKPVANGR